MSTGDTNDALQRLRQALPPWFPDPNNAPLLTSVLLGIADGFSFVYGYLSFAALQTRIASATGGWVDMIAWDFFGGRFLRRASEGDPLFAARVQQEILRPRQTVAAIVKMLTDLTGRTPLVYEPFSAYQMGCYGVGTMGYGMGRGWGSLRLANQVFVTAYRPAAAGVVNVSGYGGYLGGYGGAGSFEYINTSQITGPLLDSEIYLRVAQIVAAGTTAWTTIQS